MATIFIFQIIILVFSVILHEISHGYMAERLGDQTARYSGRLTLNPLPHIDLFGSIILPLLMYLSHTGIIFGWAKPVPYNPYNLKNRRSGEALVALAGPLSNFILALIFGLLIRFGADSLPLAWIQISVYIVELNLVLAIFNLIPIPPLDGSKILFAFIPIGYENIRVFMERYSIFLILFLLFGLGGILSPIVIFLMRLITGIAF